MKPSGRQLAHTFGRKNAHRQKKQVTAGTKRKTFVYALALLAAIGGGAYLVISRSRRSSKNNPDALPSSSDSVVVNQSLPSWNPLPTSTRTSKNATDNFPLKKGSRGERVLQLQQALTKILGTEVMKANGGADGIFGNGTVNALKQAGYPASISEATFGKIVGSLSPIAASDVNPGLIADDLYRAAHDYNAAEVVNVLKKIKSPDQYTTVNNIYKEKEYVGKTIVNDLLSFIFKNDEDSKKKITEQFSKMGLVQRDDGKWHLSGIPQYRDLITMRPTVVTDASGNKIPVDGNVIVGDQVRIQNGMTWFRSIDNSVLSVPTQDVKFNQS
jgi:hypothetical protein